jgi:hypothetical protein
MVPHFVHTMRGPNERTVLLKPPDLREMTTPSDAGKAAKAPTPGLLVPQRLEPTQGHVLSIGTTEATRHITIGLPVREYHVGFLRRALAPDSCRPAAPTSNLESFNLKRFMSVSSSEPASL